MPMTLNGDPEAIVRMVYNLVLGREPTPEILAERAAHLRGGRATAQQLAGLLAGELEPAGLVGVRAASGCTYVAPAGAPVIAELGSAQGYEPWALPYFLELCQPGMTVLDLGASWGAYALPAAQRVAPTGRVWAVEVSPQNCRTLMRSAAASGVSNLTILPFGAGDALGCRALPRQPATDNNNALIWGAAPQTHELGDYDLVPMLPLDLVRSQLGPVALVKMDIEGMEYRAVRGALELLRACRPVVFSEYSPMLQRLGSGVDGAELLQVFVDLGYRFEILHRTGPREPLTGAVAVERIEAAWRAHVAGGGTHLDLCLRP